MKRSVRATLSFFLSVFLQQVKKRERNTITNTARAVGSDKPYYSYHRVVSIQSFAYNLPIQRVYPLRRNTYTARIILTDSSLKAGKVAYSPKGIFYV